MIYVTIPVSEELPEVSGRYEVFNEWGTKFSCNYNPETGIWLHGGVSIHTKDSGIVSWLKPVTTLAEIIKHCPEVRKEVKELINQSMWGVLQGQSFNDVWEQLTNDKTPKQ